MATIHRFYCHTDPNEKLLHPSLGQNQYVSIKFYCREIKSIQNNRQKPKLSIQDAIQVKLNYWNNRVSHTPSWSQTWHIAEGCLKLLILLPLPPGFLLLQSCSTVSSLWCPGIEPRTLFKLYKYSTSWVLSLAPLEPREMTPRLRTLVVIPVPRDSVLSLDSLGTRCTCGAQLYIQAKHQYT